MKSAAKQCISAIVCVAPMLQARAAEPVLTHGETRDWILSVRIDAQCRKIAGDARRHHGLRRGGPTSWPRCCAVAGRR